MSVVTVDSAVRYDDKYWGSRFIYELAMNPEVREVSTRTESFTWAEHQEWWERRIVDSLILLVWVHRRAVGYVRWGKANPEDAEVAIAITPGEWGKGYAKEALLLSEPPLRWWWYPRPPKMVALVVKGNERSERLFVSAGYKPVGEVERMGKWHTRFEK